MALQLLAAGAAGFASTIDALALDGAPNLLGAGWLPAYGTLSGSPVAALAVALLEDGAAVPVVLSLVFAVTVVSLTVLALAYRPYSRGVLWAAERSVSGPRGFAAFLLAIGLSPLLLIAS